jgi:hypothetical protein
VYHVETSSIAGPRKPRVAMRALRSREAGDTAFPRSRSRRGRLLAWSGYPPKAATVGVQRARISIKKGRMVVKVV